MKKTMLIRFIAVTMAIIMLLPIFSVVAFTYEPLPEFRVIVVDSLDEAIAVFETNRDSEDFVILEFTENVDIEAFQQWLDRERSLSLKIFLGAMCWWALENVAGRVANRILVNYTGRSGGEWIDWAIDGYIAGWRGSRTFPRPCRCIMCH